MRLFLVIALLVTPIFAGSYLPTAQADDGMHFHCSECGSHDHGSLHHRND